MEGENPQDAMSAALANARCQLPDLDTAQLATQLGQQMIEQHAAERGRPAQLMAPVDATEQYHFMQQQPPAGVHGSGRTAHNRQPQGLGSIPKQRVAAPFSVPESKDMSQSPTHGLRSMRNSGTETSAQHTMNAWRNDVNNPKTESYRFTSSYLISL